MLCGNEVKKSYRLKCMWNSSHKEMLAWIRFSAVVDNNFAQTTTLFSTPIFCIPSDIAVLFKKERNEEKTYVLFWRIFYLFLLGLFRVVTWFQWWWWGMQFTFWIFYAIAMSTHTHTLTHKLVQRKRIRGNFLITYHGDSCCSLALTHFILMKKKWRKMLYLYRNFRFQQVMQQNGMEHIAPTFCWIKIKQKRVCFYSGELRTHIDLESTQSLVKPSNTKRKMLLLSALFAN